MGKITGGLFGLLDKSPLSLNLDNISDLHSCFFSRDSDTDIVD